MSVNEKSVRMLWGYAAIVGGVGSLMLAPVLVTIKYMTGWAIIPQPSWVTPFRDGMGSWLQFAPPTQLWTTYGMAYSVALSLMLVGFIGLIIHLRREAGRLPSKGYWLVLAGLCLVLPGDAIHSWTWHRTGLTTPTPGTYPLANTAYAIHMMGMNIVMIGSLMIGIGALPRKATARRLGRSFLLVFPAALLASALLLPTTPSGALWWLSLIMIASGFLLATGRGDRLVASTA